MFKMALVNDSGLKNALYDLHDEEQWNGPNDPEFCVMCFTTERYSLFAVGKETKGTI